MEEENPTQPMKRQKLFLIKQQEEAIEVEYNQTFNITDEQKHIVQSLKLEKSIDINYQDQKSEERGEVDEKDENILNRVSLMTEKVIIELSHLANLSTMLKASKSLTLEPCYESLIENREFYLPPTQRIVLLSKCFENSKKTLEKGKLEFNQVLTEKNNYFHQISKLKKFCKIVIIDKTTKKIVKNRLFNMKTDFLAIDSDLPIINEVKEKNKEFEKLNIIPLDFCSNGLIISEKEKNREFSTIEISLINRKFGTELCKITSWEVKNLLNDVKNMEINENNEISEILQHVNLLKHETKVKKIFEKMREECFLYGDQWVFTGSNMGENGFNVLNALYSEKLVNSLTILSITEKSVSLLITDSFEMKVKLIPIILEQNESQENESDVKIMIKKSLICCLLHLEVLGLTGKNGGLSIKANKLMEIETMKKSTIDENENYFINSVKNIFFSHLLQWRVKILFEKLNLKFEIFNSEDEKDNFKLPFCLKTSVFYVCNCDDKIVTLNLSGEDNCIEVQVKRDRKNEIKLLITDVDDLKKIFVN